ncbi:MAG: molybdenum cofactor biosynthesis protein, partial [Corynebacterium camporealensis]|nr:molybdenum cofactor biosynthesis protein [Corynebacterium camporealensis]
MTEKLDLDSSGLREMAEPDDAFLLASEKEDKGQALRRALVVVSTDHPTDEIADTSRLVGELLSEAGFTVDGSVVVRSKKSKIRQAIETAVVGGV